MEPKRLELCPWCNQLLKAKAKPIKLKRITQIQVQVGEEKYDPITIASRAYGAVSCPNCGKEIYVFT